MVFFIYDPRRRPTAVGVGAAAAPTRLPPQGPMEQRPAPKARRLVEGLGAAPPMVETLGATAAAAALSSGPPPQSRCRSAGGALQPALLLPRRRGGPTQPAATVPLASAAAAALRRLRVIPGREAATRASSRSRP